MSNNGQLKYSMATWWQYDDKVMAIEYISNVLFNQGDIMPAMFLSGIQIIDYLK